ncbi:hypothetical protein TELCIR_14605 [Teladorsagia circumcincta]|uniref:Endoplasmic reticulum vesicle transporter N-terminal domain-containing protein n=1 Tax=Teladorsagia circumcincta TaxID=45464 RepID=A0A2G9U0L8_TELCI|nr:hypothetical protein TELCIR_14605 [Teladorsagia circumcincta]
MNLDTSGLRQRRTGVSKIVEDPDIFEKVVDNVKEEKKVSSGLTSLICSSVIFCLAAGELLHYTSGKKEFEYRFDVDTSMNDMPTLDVDMVVATPCNNLAVSSTMDESSGLFAPLKQTIKKDPTRFELTEEEQLYWTGGGLKVVEVAVFVQAGAGLFTSPSKLVVKAHGHYQPRL